MDIHRSIGCKFTNSVFCCFKCQFNNFNGIMYIYILIDHKAEDRKVVPGWYFHDVSP